MPENNLIFMFHSPQGFLFQYLFLKNIILTRKLDMCGVMVSLLTLPQTSPGFHVSAVKVFRKPYGKRRNCSLRAISPFPTVFSTFLEGFLPFHQIQNCRLLTLSIWKSLNFVVWERVNCLSHNLHLSCTGHVLRRFDPSYLTHHRPLGWGGSIMP